MTSRQTRSAAWLIAALALTAQAALPPDLDAWVARALKEFNVPGIAVGVVKDGKLAFAKGYGVRKLGESATVDEHTVFGVASNSKAFTAAAIAMLVDEHKIAWDDPVQKHIPWFQTSDPYVTRELTVRDLLCHRSGLGLGAGDLLFWPDSDLTRDQVVAATRHIPVASSLRSRYAYNNLMFVVAGQVIEKVSGKSWDEFITERILKPLDMKETRISSVSFKAGDNVASPHSAGWRLEGTLTPVPATRDDVWAAAAGIKSNIVDMSKWVVTQLNQGKLDDSQRLWSEAASNEMWSAQTIQRVTDPPPALKASKANFSAYGLGWGLRDYRGRKLVSHTGGLTGMVTQVMMAPEENLGIIVLTNQEEGGAFSSITFHILDAFLDAPPTDWISAFRSTSLESRKKANEAEQKLASARVAASKPSLELTKYAATYNDAWYGKITITEESGKLVLRMTHSPSMVADLEPWQHDTFKAIFRDKTVPDAFVTFSLNYRGEVEQAKMTAVSSLADFSFDYQDMLLKPERPRRP